MSTSVETISEARVEWHNFRENRLRKEDVDRHDFVYNGFCFQPARDTVHIRDPTDEDLGEGTTSFLACCKLSELKTDNIQSLALDFNAFNEKSLSTFIPLMLPGLRELIIVAYWEERHDVGVEGASVTAIRKRVQGIIQKEKQERPETRIPPILVIKEKALADYVSGKYDR
jgi:hypothetical protein